MQRAVSDYLLILSLLGGLKLSFGAWGVRPITVNKFMKIENEKLVKTEKIFLETCLNQPEEILNRVEIDCAFFSFVRRFLC